MAFRDFANGGGARILDRLGTSIKWNGGVYRCSVMNSGLSDIFGEMGGGFEAAGAFTVSLLKNDFAGDNYPKPGALFEIGGKKWRVKTLGSPDDASPFYIYSIDDQS